MSESRRPFREPRAISPELPPDLAAAIDDAVGRHDRRVLEAAAARLSAAYRAQGRAAARAARTREEVVAYAAARAPATYAAAISVLGRIRLHRPGWEPRSVVDLGAGPGVASWAAAVVWPGIERFTLVDAEPEMIALGRSLAAAAPGRAVTNARWIQGDSAAEVEPADLVIASYLLGELDERAVDSLTRRVWSAAAAGIATVIEPGTPAGYARVLAARALMVAEGGFTVAPCPHDADCPLEAGDWCHFATRLPRGEVHRAVKQVSRGFEDEKFSYAVVSRTPGGRAAARVIRPPRVKSGHVYLDTCEAHGLARRIVTRRDRDAYRAARKAGWGDALEIARPSSNEPTSSKMEQP